MKSKKTIIFSAVFLAFLIAGCSSSSTPPITQGTSAEVDAALKERQYFVSAKGNFGALSPQDQAAYNKLAGGAAEGQATWKVMSQNGFSRNNAGSPGDPRTTSGRP